MTKDPLFDARAAFAAGRASGAIDLAWKAVRPAVLVQDDPVIRSTMQFAQEVASAATGDVKDQAESLASYCAACIITPRESVPSGWSMKRLFSIGSPKKTCPDCAESIHEEAKVCRYCGYRYPSAPI